MLRSWILAVGTAVAVLVTSSESFAHGGGGGGGGGANAGRRPSRYLDYNGVRLAVYESQGRGGPGVLLIHGNTSSAASFSEVLDSPFARRRRVVAVDLAGYGKSDNAPGYYAGYIADEIRFVAQATGTDDGVIVGWSLGGDLALQAAPLLPKAKGYFLFGTAPLGVTPDLPAPFLTPAESYAGNAVNYGFVPNLTNDLIDDYVTAFFRPRYRPIPRFFFTDGYRTDPNTRFALAVAAGGFDPTFRDEVAVIRGLSVPVQLLLGTQDAFVNPDYLDALAPSIPTLTDGKVTYLRNVGHAVHWEADVRFMALLTKFVRVATRDATGCDD